MEPGSACPMEFLQCKSCNRFHRWKEVENMENLLFQLGGKARWQEIFEICSTVEIPTNLARSSSLGSKAKT